jgi:hypothetical protein
MPELLVVELLYQPGCGNFAPTRANVELALQQLGLQAEVREVVVDSLARAQELGSPGSTTIRINGEDLQPSTAGGAGMG